MTDTNTTMSADTEREIQTYVDDAVRHYPEKFAIATPKRYMWLAFTNIILKRVNYKFRREDVELLMNKRFEEELKKLEG